MEIYTYATIGLRIKFRSIFNVINKPRNYL